MVNRTRATRMDVARLANVSTATVSYVVNNGPRPVAAETRERVLRAIAQLDYVPNDFARRLKGVGSSSIGYLVPNIRNPFFAEMTSAFNKALESHGYQLLLADLDDDPSREASYLELFRRKGVEGVVAWQTTSSADMVDFLLTKRIPFALVGTRHPKAASAVIDEQAAATMALAHLTALGHGRIAYFALSDTPHFPQSRFPFISRALADVGLPSGPEVFHDIASDRWVQRFMKSATRPTAAIVHNDTSAVRAIAELFVSGLKVPEDLSVVSYDNIEFARYAKVPLTTISYSKEALGRGAIELVLEQLGNAEKSRPKVIELPVELIIRESTTRPKERFAKGKLQVQRLENIPTPPHLR